MATAIIVSLTFLITAYCTRFGIWIWLMWREASIGPVERDWIAWFTEMTDARERNGQVIVAEIVASVVVGFVCAFIVWRALL